MITFLSSPKPFKGIALEHQYRAIRSWLNTADDVEVILFGDSFGIEEAGSNLGVKVVKEVTSAPSGIPYFGSITLYASEHGKYDLQVYLNCDILLSGILPALQKIDFTQFLLIGQRIDLGEGVFLDFTKMNWTSKLRQLGQAGKATLFPPSGIDYFGFRRGLWKDLPLVVIGRAGFVKALVAYCLRHRIHVVDATYSVIALHQFHDYGHIQGGKQAVWQGEDAQNNYRHAGGTHSRTMVSDASYVLKNSLVTLWQCRGDRLRSLELKLRYELGWNKTGLILKIISRGLHAIGLIQVSQLSLEDTLDSCICAYEKNCNALIT